MTLFNLKREPGNGVHRKRTSSATLTKSFGKLNKTEFHFLNLKARGKTAVFRIRIRMDLHKDMPPGSGSAWTNADPDPGGKKA